MYLNRKYTFHVNLPAVKNNVIKKHKTKHGDLQSIDQTVENEKNNNFQNSNQKYGGIKQKQ